ncbi:hypothetical protein BD324DRAFT_650180 [Kockovaella imperatae]|uniref:Uncharacterized protein n=1 Tax=Kockovaella imperatae TaxID=4999 RepID=A0A1Y1UHS8_9TREE|nr:hypothetical protein BD324DRAFT_650180 [Kockovaella imperatae]ORX37611.1 hypothetical protein BD324DRAFT_650180 [Kockovaella imperatae]
MDPLASCSYSSTSSSPTRLPPLAHPFHPTSESSSSLLFHDDSFDSYCIVCDRLITPPKEPAAQETKTVTRKKGAAGGTIRVKNPDGSTTTRTANGTKTTRPGLKRNTSSANRLAALTATTTTTTTTTTTGTAAAAPPPKLHHPLIRSKTAEPVSVHHDSTLSTSASSKSSSMVASPESHPSKTPFHSSIYCSKGCADQDAGRSNEAFKHLSRTFSNEFALPHPPFAQEHGIYYASDANADPHAPPSPLFISGSDTDSSNAGGPEGPACSAPRALEYFRISRGGPDDAWRDHQRQRRSSMHYSIAPVPMTRQLSNHSSVHRGFGGTGFGGMSSDSLSSLWNLPATEADIDVLTRVQSSHGHDRGVLGSGRRSISSLQSERSVPIPSRGSAGQAPASLVRSGVSQTSLVSGGSPAGSVPQDQTLSLLQSYATHFPIREPTVASSSYSSHKGVLPSSTSASRRESLSMTPQLRFDMPALQSRRSESSATTWDQYGLDEVEANNARAARAARHASDAGLHHAGGLSVPRASGFTDITPKQSLEVENGKWKVRYGAPTLTSSGTIKQKSRRHAPSPTRSHTSSSSEEDAQPIRRPSSTNIYTASPQPVRPPLSRSKSQNSPEKSTSMPPPASIPVKAPAAHLVRLDSPNPSESTPKGHGPISQSPTSSRVLNAALAQSVPSRTFFTSTSPSRQATSATGNAPNGSFGEMPNLAALRLQSGGSGRCTPMSDGAAPSRSGFNWADHEAKGGKMYELPKGLTIDRSKAGLFYFN